MAEFPDIASKLGAPTKKTVFEKQKAEAEAKKAKEKAETAAALAEFENSFDAEDASSFQRESRGPPAPGKRHFSGIGLKSGPGSLPKSGPGSLGTVYDTKKRRYDGYSDRNRRPAFRSGSKDDGEEEQEEKAAKPTLHLASMPPGTSAAFIKGLFAHTPLNVEYVRQLPSTSNSSTERKSCAAIVTLAAETPASDIDTVVSHMQNRYLGFGFKLSISRHLSSAAVGSAAITSSTLSALPFGARPIAQQTSLSRAPPPGHRGFAPPQSYTSSTPYGRAPTSQVTVQAPSDLKQLKLIHKTLEALLTYGPEFEALLMSRSEIQRDEKWAWLWDSLSVGGVYYRWRLWDILTDASKKHNVRGSGHQVLFEGQSAWQPPEAPLKFEYTTQVNEFVSDEDYNSSDEEEDDEGRGGDLARRYNDHNVPAMSNLEDPTDGLGYLDPLGKTKLTHLLSRLPDSNTKLRRGDVARITAFAIEHAGAGGDEVASLVTRNVLHPFSQPEGNDKTPASMVGLLVISDILSSSASAGVRHAWRYRTLFEQALRQQRVFERLGRAEKVHKWGKLKGEKWKRSVQNLLSLWEGWSVFPQATQEHFVSIFDNPPLTEEEKKAITEAERTSTPEEATKSKPSNRWKTVDEAESDTKMDDLDGAPMPDDDDDISMSDLEGIDGVPMIDSSDEELEQPRAEPRRAEQPTIVEATRPAEDDASATSTSAPARRQRTKAADMFADDSD